MGKILKSVLFFLIITSIFISFSSCSLFTKSVDVNLTIEKLD